MYTYIYIYIYIYIYYNIYNIYFPLMTLTIYCYKKKDFGFQRLSPYIKDSIAHMIGIENVIQNALSKDRTYDN